VNESGFGKNIMYFLHAQRMGGSFLHENATLRNLKIRHESAQRKIP
jgi:hypothetical protein